MAEEMQKVVIVLDTDLHAQVKAMAAHYGASIRGTLARYAREGVERDQKTIRDQQ